MCDTPDLRLVVSLCARYPVVWCDSSLRHCSKAFGKKALVIGRSSSVGRPLAQLLLNANGTVIWTQEIVVNSLRDWTDEALYQKIFLD